MSDIEAEDATLKGDYLWKVVDIGIGGVPTILEVRFICWFLSLGRMLLPNSVLTNLFDRMRHQLDIRKVDVGI
jgi:hypothetical protein